LVSWILMWPTIWHVSVWTFCTILVRWHLGGVSWSRLFPDSRYGLSVARLVCLVCVGVWSVGVWSGIWAGCLGLVSSLILGLMASGLVCGCLSVRWSVSGMWSGLAQLHVLVQLHTPIFARRRPSTCPLATLRSPQS
jgi:hypothetical protein